MIPGDLIVGVDGVAFETPRQIAAAMVQALGDEVLLLFVLRGRRSFEIEFPVPGGLTSKDDPGFRTELAVR